jgi:hypothetical protein
MKEIFRNPRIEVMSSKYLNKKDSIKVKQGFNLQKIFFIG